MEYSLYLHPFLRAIILVGGVAGIIRWLIPSRGNCNKGAILGRHVHVHPISRLGGLAIIFGFLGALLADTRLFFSEPLVGVCLATGVILVFGLVDDIWELGWKSQLAVQTTLAFLVYWWGVRILFISNPFGGVIWLQQGDMWFPGLTLMVLWILVVMNAVNWMDGIDGLSGGVTFLAAGVIFLLALKPEVNQPPVGIIAIALAGAVLGFLLFNFYPARLFAGTTGSMFMGFILAVLAIFAGTKIATALLVLAVPMVDFVWVIAERFLAGQAIVRADQRHLHHKLLALGWSQQKIAWLFYGITGTIGFVALYTQAVGKFVAVIVSLSLVAVAVGVTSWKYRRIQKNAKN